MKTYKGRKTDLISFPLGGIGSGCVGLAGNGALKDWEIFNRPFKGSANGFTHFCVKAEKNGAVEDVRVLQGDFTGPAEGGETVNVVRGNGGFGYGFGPYRGTMAGVPHFQNMEFCGEYPIAELHFEDEKFPGRVTLRAFNPFIPLNDRDSSIPAAFFEVIFENTTREEREYTAVFSLNNPLPYGTTRNRFLNRDGIKAIYMDSSALEEKDLLYGNLCMATDAIEYDYQEYWYRAEWFDSLTTYWEELNRGGKLLKRAYQKDVRKRTGKKLDGEDMASLAGRLSVRPGEKKSIRFVLSWSFPNCTNYWKPETEKEEPVIWKNYYATLFDDAIDSAVYGMKKFEGLYLDTMKFKNALYATSLPEECLEAVSANLSILKSATCFRLTDGSFYGFEGCAPTEGSCEGSCSHVWNYAYALPYLFPALERSMRDLEYRYSQREDGSVAFRLQLPLGRKADTFRACVDGQMGGVIKVYRDYKLCGDREWLKGKWEAVKKSLEFAWSQENYDGWDWDKDGVMEGRQHHTLDMELFGPNSWLNGFYQAALLAGARIAEILGKTEEAREYQGLYEKGKEWVEKHLFNGEYYQQSIDLKDKKFLEKYNQGGTVLGVDAAEAYWNQETEEIKYQVANGCLIDQVIGEWHGRLCGLGDVFDREHVRSALKAIYRYNYKTSMRNEFNPARVYSLNDEGGVHICSYPKEEAPQIPITYGKEVFCGMEYQVASHMLWEGMYQEGISIVKTVRERFDGEVRNPWNEFECGSNYARSMASFALIPAASGFSFDLGKGELGFSPNVPGWEFDGFFSTAEGWGIYRQREGKLLLEVLYGEIHLNSLKLPVKAIKQANLGGTSRRFEEREKLYFPDGLCIKAGMELEIIFGEKDG